MARRHYNLPPLKALAAFEASARHSSLKYAAQELNVTPGAVSHQVKALEEDLGVDLFKRLHRGVALTAEGEELYAVLARGFSQTAAVLQRIRDRGSVQAVTIGATTAFASMWLMPKIGAFWRRYPDVIVNHRITDNPHELRNADIDLRIRYGKGKWPEEESALLFSDRIFPVCSAGFAARYRPVKPGDLPGLSLIHLEGVDSEWTGWAEWFERAGVDCRRLRGREFNNYAIALQAAQDDHGVALGWGRLVAGLLKEGKLVRLTEAEIEAPGAFYICWSANQELSSQARELRDWLIQAAQQEEG